MRKTLLQQLEIVWMLATQHYFPALTDELAHWNPSSNAVGLRMRDGAAYPEWPDEKSDPIPDTTAGWLLWHIEWWWSNAIEGVRGGASADPLSFAWSGSAEASRERLDLLHTQWVEILNSTPMDHQCAAPFPTPQPLSTIAAWVNMELMKNLAELGLLIRLRANRS
jgi:hypothetical protein